MSNIYFPKHFSVKVIKSRLVPRNVIQVVMNRHDAQKYRIEIDSKNNNDINMRNAVTPDSKTGKYEKDFIHPNTEVGHNSVRFRKGDLIFGEFPTV